MQNLTAPVLALQSIISSAANSLALVIAALAVSAATPYTSSAHASTPNSPVDAAATMALSSPVTAAYPDHWPNGTYVYGQSPERDQIGQAYLVFEANADTVVGGFYMPSSSFDCFQGEVKADRLALTITDSYTAETYAYGLPVDTTAPIAAQDPQVPLGLEGFQALAGMSDLDQQILATCKANAGL